MKKVTKKYIDERFEFVTNLFGEIAYRLEKLEERILHEIRVSDGAELPWESPTELTERLEAAEGVFDELETRSPSSPLAQTPPELLPDAANDGHTQNSTSDEGSKQQ